MALQNIYRNNECHVDKFGSTSKLVGEVILTINYIFNKETYKKLKNTLHELWKGKRNFYKYLKVWVCHAKVVVLDFKKINIGPKTIYYVFIDYDYNSSVY